MAEDAKLEQFYRLVEQHHVALRAFVAALGVSPDWVDDVAQEAFLKAYVDFERFDAGRDFGRWLRGIARNIVRNEVRSRARRRRILHERVADIMLERADEPIGLFDDERQGLHDALKQCLDELPEKSRQLVRMRYAEERAAADMAESLDSTPPAIRQALVRLRAGLRQCIDRKLGRAGA